MNKIILLFLILIVLDNCYAWKASTHEQFVENIYYSMPSELQSNLSLDKMKLGSVAPDAIFKDFKNHHYPKSLSFAKKWLENDSDLSYNFGVASHYISDSFSSPHNIAKEDYSNHEKFETLALNYNNLIECKDYGLRLDTNLAEAAKNEKDWSIWLKTKNKKIIENEQDQVMKLLYSVAINKFNYGCNNISKIKLENNYFDNANLFKAGIVFLVGLPLLYFFKEEEESD